MLQLGSSIERAQVCALSMKLCVCMCVYVYVYVVCYVL